MRFTKRLKGELRAPFSKLGFSQNQCIRMCDTVLMARSSMIPPAPKKKTNKTTHAAFRNCALRRLKTETLNMTWLMSKSFEPFTLQPNSNSNCSKHGT